MFSRIPQKRGPSKGYIKELADRINHIEGKLANEGANVDSLNDFLGGVRRESSDLFTPGPTGDDSGRKRPFSNISGGDFGTPTRQNPWSTEPRPLQPYQSSNTPYSANGLAPKPLGKADDGHQTRHPDAIDEISLDLDHNGEIRELNQDAFEGYLAIVHPCYPLLSGDKSHVETLLNHCPSLLRDAFLEALYGTMQSFV